MTICERAHRDSLKARLANYRNDGHGAAGADDKRRERAWRRDGWPTRERALWAIAFDNAQHSRRLAAQTRLASTALSHRDMAMRQLAVCGVHRLGAEPRLP